MMFTPCVSVITPAYNAARFIGETIRSVQEQDETDWEMVIVDDGSTDNTVAVVTSFAKEDARIRLVRQRNQGPAAARNRALELAKGRFLAFLDSDDLWLPNKLSLQLEVMERAGAGLSYAAFRRMSSDGSRVGRLFRVPPTIDYRGLLRKTVIGTLTAMVDREWTGPIRMTDKGYDDYILWLSLLRQGVPAAGVTEDVARYRVLSGSVSSRPLQSAGWVWRIYRGEEGLDPLVSSWLLARYAVSSVFRRIPV